MKMSKPIMVVEVKTMISVIRTNVLKPMKLQSHVQFNLHSSQNKYQLAFNPTLLENGTVLIALRIFETVTICSTYLLFCS